MARSRTRKPCRPRDPAQRLARLMGEGLKPLKRAMNIKAPTEVTAPLHNAVMCLLLALQAQRTERRARRAQPHRRD